MSLVEIAVAIGSFGLSVVAFLAATRAQSKSQRLEQVKVDAEAYTRAQSIYDKSIEQLSKRNEELATEVKECKTRIEELERALRLVGRD